MKMLVTILLGAGLVFWPAAAWAAHGGGGGGHGGGGGRGGHATHGGSHGSSHHRSGHRGSSHRRTGRHGSSHHRSPTHHHTTKPAKSPFHNSGVKKPANPFKQPAKGSRNLLAKKAPFNKGHHHGHHGHHHPHHHHGWHGWTESQWCEPLGCTVYWSPDDQCWYYQTDQGDYACVEDALSADSAMTPDESAGATVSPDDK